ncbi:MULTISPECIES: CaiB/BaiF CoA transferase family protein [Ramlibacter]|uniref:CoA transferase n=1 Tax=Ramlibacter pinisoli TaxID=2682844 RepID=A0A6N8IXH6_9BURK|nr:MULTISPECIES: CoA transferase [Ramlibacter]MBA2961777.1 CoA transferase [Ramlibacter sp. CGMCC 1.13660]MVQ31719.1 CoA transferase [Ramlibacter pinisoli]
MNQDIQAAARPPLAGVRIVDWTHILAGPYATYILAVLGAEVIRIERHDECDIIRSTVQDPKLAAFELGEGFVMQAAGKKSIAVDARDPEVRAALGRLIASADVLVENFRPGKLASLGFDPQELVERHPELIVCSITGYGQTGERAGRRAYDHVIQAASGLMAANADAQGRPQRIGLPIIDYATGTQAALGIIAALHRRARDRLDGQVRRRGEWLDVAMHEVALTLSAQTFASHAVSGIARKATRSTAFSGNPLSGTFETAKGYLAIVCNSEAQNSAFLRAMRADGVEAPEVERLAHLLRDRAVEDVHAWLAPVLARREAVQWEAFFRVHEVPAAEALSPAAAYEAVKNDRARWPEVELANADGRKVCVPGAGFDSSLTLLPPLTAPPLRGEHTLEVLRGAGMDARTLESALARGAIRHPWPAGERKTA